MKKILFTFFFAALAMVASSSVHAQSYTGDPEGNVESATCSVASGWSYDPDYTQPVIYGCTNSSATNYDPNATNDDGSCVVPQNVCVSRYRWVNITAGAVNPVQGCNAVGATPVTTYTGGRGFCASGEDRPTSGYDMNSINYSRGTWGGGNGGGGDSTPFQNGGYRCYNDSLGQKHDGDNTDVAVAYYCDFGNSYPESCPADYPPARTVGGGSGGCFTSSTLIKMSDGSAKPVSNLEVGDIVRGETSNNQVLEVKHVLLGDRPLYSIDGRDAFVTAGHPFKTTDGWKSIDPAETVKEGVDLSVTQLAVGDSILTETGTEKVVSIVPQSADASMVLYNPVLDGDHTYYANGLLVHNKVADDYQTTQLFFAPHSFLENLASLFKPLQLFAASSDSNSVLIYDGNIDNGSLLATVPADIYRPDVNAVMGTSGNHGFSWDIPQSLKDGNSHTLSFYGTNIDAYGKTSELSGSSVTIQCPAGQTNSAPSSPSLSCPPDGSYTNTPLGVSFTSTDADGNNIKYLIDWDADGSIDEVVPSGGAFVPSGTQQASARSWSTGGQKTVIVSTEDDQGAISSGAQCNFSVVDNPGFCNDSTASNYGSPLPCSYQPQTDACPNITGQQDSVPAGYALDGSGNCVSICATNPQDPSCIGGGGVGGNGDNSGGNGGQTTGFTISGNSPITIQFLSNLAGMSKTSNLSVNPVSNFNAPVTISVQSIRNGAGADMPSGNVPVYYFDGQPASSVTMTYDASSGFYKNPSGTIGATFAVKIPQKITEPYYITLAGASGGQVVTFVIQLTPLGVNPSFHEF